MHNFPRTGSVSDFQCLQQGLPECWQQTTAASLQATTQGLGDVLGATGSSPAETLRERSPTLGLYDGFTMALFLGCSGLASLLLSYQRSARRQRQVAQLERLWRL
jgi:hypothetical protein